MNDRRHFPESIIFFPKRRKETEANWKLKLKWRKKTGIRQKRGSWGKTVEMLPMPLRNFFFLSLSCWRLISGALIVRCAAKPSIKLRNRRRKRKKERERERGTHTADGEEGRKRRNLLSVSLIFRAAKKNSKARFKWSGPRVSVFRWSDNFVSVVVSVSRSHLFFFDEFFIISGDRCFVKKSETRSDFFCQRRIRERKIWTRAFFRNSNQNRIEEEKIKAAIFAKAILF